MTGVADGEAENGVATTSEIVTAGLLVIGDEILSGRTKDKNIGFAAEYLTAIGIDLKEVRVVPDDEPEIVGALNALRARYTYVFTTGGIGPTHDDITAEAVAKAFGVAIDYHPQALEILRARLTQTGGVMNEARMRMARMPVGAELVLNKVSAAPGFRIGNVIVMAGIPQIMQAMLEFVTPQLKTGAKMLSETVRADCREGDIGTELGAIAKAHPDVVIGSYPFLDENQAANAHVVMRSRDAKKLAVVKAEVAAMLRRVREALAAG
jgi:molybdenum cofactor synthesis domain-containing protein